jgi:hypothetical protein
LLGGARAAAAAVAGSTARRAHARRAGADGVGARRRAEVCRRAVLFRGGQIATTSGYCVTEALLHDIARLAAAPWPTGRSAGGAV